MSLYFYFCVTFIGAVIGLGIVCPLKLLGKMNRLCDKLADKALCFGVKLLLNIQPKLKIHIDLQSLPDSCLIVSNHRSNLDAFILLANIPGLRLLAKRSLFHVPFLGLVMKVLNQIPVFSEKLTDKSLIPISSYYHEALLNIEQSLRLGYRVHVFPEMTRCEPHTVGVNKFHVGAFVSACKAKVPIIVLGFANTDSIWPKKVFTLKFDKTCYVKQLGTLSSQQDPFVLCRQARKLIEAFLQ